MAAKPSAGKASMKAPEAEPGGGLVSWLTVLGFLFLTFNSGMAVYRSNGDVGAIAFVVVSYADLLALLGCLRWYERAEIISPKREHVKAAVWSLTALLSIVFSHKVAEIMPPLVRMMVWAMASATVRGGFYAFFLHAEGKAAEHGNGSTAELAPLSGGRSTTSGTRLVADTGATMHAVGDRSLLVDVQPSRKYKTVRVPAMNIELPVVGVGRIEWENFSIPNVYLVEGLQKNVISISQLDKDHGTRSVFGHGRCQITMADGTTVGEAEVDESDQMYVLSRLEVPEPAQV